MIRDVFTSRSYSSCIKVLLQRSNTNCNQNTHSLYQAFWRVKHSIKKLMMFSWSDYHNVKTNIYNRKFTEQLLFSFYKLLIMVHSSRLSSFTCLGLVWIRFVFHWKSYIGDNVLRQKKIFSSRALGSTRQELLSNVSIITN